jgi:hypothetical protein
MQVFGKQKTSSWLPNLILFDGILIGLGVGFLYSIKVIFESMIGMGLL